jgi:hypothetical protein
MIGEGGGGAAQSPRVSGCRPAGSEAARSRLSPLRASLYLSVVGWRCGVMVACLLVVAGFLGGLCGGFWTVSGCC